MLGRDVVGLRATLARVRGILVGVCLVAVAVSAGVLAWVVRRSLWPIKHLSAQIADVGESDLSTRIDTTGIPSEMTPVVERLNELLARLEAAFQRERRFTGDVAHELRTPLAGLRAKLELALSRERTPQAYRAAMGDCLAVSLHMQHMVENLLHLARADAGQLEVRRAPVDPAKIIRECWGPLEDRANARGLRVGWHLQEVGAVETDRDKLRLVIYNVLDNAVTYADEDGAVQVSLSAEHNGLTLAVSNPGSSLSRDEVGRVFGRFWRADSSHRPTGETHCGLGLPLCRTVIEQLGGSIDAKVDDAGVFTLTIHLPRGGLARRGRVANVASIG